jgi:CubicO group peptidase (beta-lactamase class C family)
MSAIHGSARRPARVASAQDWPTIALAESGLAPDLGARLDAAFAAGELDGLHAVVVARHGALAFERYYAGVDQAWGRPLGQVVFGPEVLHDLRSVTKSVVGLLYGIALHEGKAPALDAPLIDQFPALGDLAADPARRRMTVAHALTMTLGLDWNEDLPYDDPANSEIAMEHAPDRYRFVLSQPIVAEPGARWRYNGGATALLAHLIARGTGVPLLDYAREKLFVPLGITGFVWTPGTNGEPSAASGLRLTPRDLAKLGQLVLDGGKWGAAQLVPRAWLDASFTRHAQVDDMLGYGYQWWLGKLMTDGKPWVAGFGNGGQRLMVVPSRDLVVAILCGRYNEADAWKLPVKVLTDFVRPGGLKASRPG